MSLRGSTFSSCPNTPFLKTYPVIVLEKLGRGEEFTHNMTLPDLILPDVAMKSGQRRIKRYVDLRRDESPWGTRETEENIKISYLCSG